MKTILNKIDPKYIECASGVCEHAAHKANTVVWLLIAVAVITLLSKYTHGIIKGRN